MGKSTWNINISYLFYTFLIAFMKKVLDTYKVPNTLSQFLSNASHYKVPTFNKLAR